MRKLRILISAIMVFLFVLCFAATTLAQDVGIDITAPSDAESTIAQGRSFYVLGTFKNGKILSDGDKVTVEIKDASGKVVRCISTTIKANTTMYVMYPGLSYYGKDRSELLTAGMPDLIWDGKQLSSFHNGDIKLYYNDTEFAALIPGGEGMLNDGMNLRNNAGYPYDVLKEGKYTISVYITDNTDVKGDAADATRSAEKQLVIGTTANKLLSRFSPSAHMERIVKEADKNGWRIYNDLFPGYWSKNGIFCEITSQWRAADAIEYAAGKAHFIIYNVKSTSATYSVELSMLQRIAAMNDPDKLQCYYYEYGEPTLPNGVESDIVEFLPQDKLQLVRAELTGLKTTDNVYNQDKPEAESYDLNLTDGVNAKVGDTLSLYGVTAPIQINLNDLTDNGNNAFQPVNRIKTIKYSLSGDGIDKNYEKQVLLNRVSGGWDNYSELEFKHDIPITADMAGRQLKIELAAYDSYGRLVNGTEESFDVLISTQAAEVQLPQTADAATVLGFIMLAAATLGFAVKRRKS